MKHIVIITLASLLLLNACGVKGALTHPSDIEKTREHKAQGDGSL